MLLDAFAEVRKKHSEAMLTICGDGEEMENLRAQAKGRLLLMARWSLPEAARVRNAPAV